MGLILASHTVHLCVLYGFRKTQLSIPHTALTVFYNQEEVGLLRGTSWIFRRIQFNLSFSRVETDCVRSDKIIFRAVLWILQPVKIKVTGYPKFSLYAQI